MHRPGNIYLSEYSEIGGGQVTECALDDRQYYRCFLLVWMECMRE